MAEVKITITAEDKTQGAFSAAAAAAKTAFSAVESSANSAFSGLISAAESVGSKIGSVFKTIQANWLAVAGAIGSMMFLKNMAAQSYEAELASSRLKIQIEGLGVAYASVAPQVNSAIEATSKYAIVQEEEVESVLQQLIFYSGNVDESMKRLNLTYDFAYQKGIDVSQSAALIGQAMAGNVEMLGRHVPRLRNLEETLGKNAIEAEKTAYAFAVLEKKSADALSKMTENQKLVKEGTKAWHDLRQAIGGVIMTGLAYTILGIKELFTGAAKTQITKKALDDLNVALYGTADIMEIVGEAHKRTEEQIAREAKARSDSIETVKSAIKELEKYSDVIKSVGAEALKFAEADFTKNIKLPGEQIAEMAKSIADTEKILSESSKLLSIEGVIENNSAAVRRYYALQKTYITEVNALREKEQNALGSLKTTMDDYGIAIDTVYGNQLAKQTAIKTQLERQKSILESQNAKPQDVSAAAEAIAKQSAVILETEKKQAEARYGMWQQYYASVSSLHSQAIEAQKQKTLELVALEKTIAAQRQGYAEMQEDLAARSQPKLSPMQQWYKQQEALEKQLTAASVLSGQGKTEALTAYQNKSKEAADLFASNQRLGAQAAQVASTQIAAAQETILAEQNKLSKAKQDEITKTNEWAAALKTDMTNAEVMVKQYTVQIIDLGEKMSALKLNVDTLQAMTAVSEVKTLIDSIPSVTTKTIVINTANQGVGAPALSPQVPSAGPSASINASLNEFFGELDRQQVVIEIMGKGSAIKPISEKIEDIKTMFGSLSALSPSITADFSQTTNVIPAIARSISDLLINKAAVESLGVGLGFQGDRLKAGKVVGDAMDQSINLYMQLLSSLLAGGTSVLETTTAELQKTSGGLQNSITSLGSASSLMAGSVRDLSASIEEAGQLQQMLLAKSIVDTISSLNIGAARSAATGVGLGYLTDMLAAGAKVANAQISSMQLYTSLFEALFGEIGLSQIVGSMPRYTYTKPTESFASGTPYVPRDMIAQIHKGEAIVPAQYNRSPLLGGDSGVGNSPLGSGAGVGKTHNTYHVNVGNIKIIASGQETPAALAKKLVKPIRDELRRLAQLQ